MFEWETSVMVIRDPAGRVLLVHQNYGLHLYGLPGGKVEDGEEPEQAAIREVREETGLIVTAAGLLGIEDLVYPGSGRRYRAYAFRCGLMRGEPAVQMPHEISSVDWHDIGSLPSPLTPSAAVFLSDGRRQR